MFVEEHGIFSRRTQCKLLGISRSSLYHKKRERSKEDLQLMKAIDLQYTKTPFYGRRRMTVALREEGFSVGYKKVRNSMKAMGLEAIYPKRNLSKANPLHKKYKYLMNDVKVDRPNFAWCADITYIPIFKGFVYLFAIMDWYSRYVIAWELSNLLEASFCVSALERGLKVNVPEIFNTDQGVQFTSICFTKVLEGHGVKISMDGRGRAFDNIFIERLWRSVKYENVYPNSYESIAELEKGLGNYFKFYNEERPHQSLAYKVPAEVHFETPPPPMGGGVVCGAGW